MTELGYSTLFLSVGCLIAVVLLGATRCRSWWLRRFVWSGVLLLGVVPFCGVSWTLDVPVLKPHLAGTPAIETAAEEMVGNRPPGDCVGDSRLEANTSDSSAEYRTLPPGGRQPTHASPPTSDVADSLLPSAVCNLPSCIWLFGIVIVLTHTLFYSFRFHYSLRETEPASTDWTNAWNAMQNELGVRRPIPMLTSDTHGPVLVRQWFDYIFIVPLEGWDNLSEAQRKSVMRHELEHYRRGDVWTSAIARMITLIHWFNPFAYFSLFRFEEAAEWACDEAALGKRGESTEIFASALVSLNKSLNISPAKIQYGHSIFGRNFSSRVARMTSFESTLNTKESIMKKAFLFTIVVLLFAAVFVRVRLVAKEPGTASPDGDTVAGSRENTLPLYLSEQPFPTVTVRGKVFMPDGSPAKNRYVELTYQQLTRNAGTFLGTRTDDNGAYSFQLPLGVQMTALVKNPEKSSQWLEDGLASPLLFATVLDNPVAGLYDIRLKQGIPVSGTVRYEDGTAAAGRIIKVEMFALEGRVPLPVTDNPGAVYYYRPSKNQHVFTDKDGRYTFWLLPNQEYELEVADLMGEARTQPLPKLARGEEGRTIDFTLPQPTVFTFILPDGKATTDVDVCIDSRMDERNTNRQIQQLLPEADGVYRAVLSPIANLISVRTKDGKFGINRVIRGDERLKPIALALESPVIGKVKFVEKETGTPIVDRRLSYFTSKRLGDDVFLNTNNFRPVEIKTDENGVATLSMFVGADYSLYDGFDYKDKPRLPGVGFSPQKSGETVDKGTIEVAK